jgi:hypothetical protein
MQIKIEIDVKPEELRRFLGLPDVAGLQDDVVRFLRDKVSAAGESFDPSAAMHASFDLLKRTPAWRLLRNVIVTRDEAPAAEPEPAAEPPPAAEPEAPAEPQPPASPRATRKRAPTRPAKTAAKKRSGRKSAAA